MARLSYRIATVLLSITLIISACTPAAQTEAPSAATPVTAPTEVPAEAPTEASPSSRIVIALAAAPVSLDPADHRSRESETVIRNMFDGLVTRDATNGVHMELAESMEWADEQTLNIKLREGVKFHDGTEMTADDVVFTFERIINENMIEFPEAHSSPRKGLIAPLESIEKTGDYTVTMHFSGPWPPAMQLLVHQQIVPKAYIEEVGTEGFIAKPIGTGPFKFVSVQPGFEQVILERFDDYYGGSPTLTPVGKACAVQVVFSVIPEASTRVSALLAGEVDIIANVSQDLIASLSGNEDVQVKTAAGTQPKWIELNVNKPPFDDVNVRKALNYAVDKELIIQQIYGGRAVALPGALSPFNSMVNKSLSPYPYDTAMATDLLTQAGWADTDGDSILDKDGQALVLTIDTLEEWRPLAEAVADMYRAIGIDANVRFWEYSVIRDQLLAGDRQAYLDDWGDSAFDPVGHFEAKWHGFVADTPYGRGNFSTYNNERVNELIQQGETTGDTAARQAIYDEAQQIVYDEAPAVFLILPEEVEAASASISNWTPASDSRENMHDVCKAE